MWSRSRTRVMLGMFFCQTSLQKKLSFYGPNFEQFDIAHDKNIEIDERMLATTSSSSNEITDAEYKMCELNIYFFVTIIDVCPTHLIRAHLQCTDLTGDSCKVWPLLRQWQVESLGGASRSYPRRFSKTLLFLYRCTLKPLASLSFLS